MQRRTTFVHIQSWVCLGKVGGKWMQIALISFSFHQNPFNNLLPNKILTYLRIQLFIKHMLICLQKIKIPTTTFVNAIVAFFQPTCFHNKSNLDTRSLSYLSMIVHTLHFTYVTFPSTPMINSAQGNFATHESWKQWFISYIFLIFLLFAKFVSIWAGSTTRTKDSTFWLELVIGEGSTRTRSEKKLCVWSF